MVKVWYIVNYILDDQANHPGEIRPAIVVASGLRQLSTFRCSLMGKMIILHIFIPAVNSLMHSGKHLLFTTKILSQTVGT